MFNSIAIDVVIGIIFIFLLYSLLASIIQEFVAKSLGLRARMLLKAISKLLDDDEDFNEAKGFCRLNVFKNYYQHPFKNRPFSKVFYNHPSIKYLGKNEFSRKPSYLSDTLFAETLIKILRTDKFTGSENQMQIIRDHLESNTEINLKKYKASENDISLKIGYETKSNLLELVSDSGNDLEKFKARLEQWFNEMMDRAEGWYTRQTRAILFVIGLVLAIGFNIDTISIAKLLATNNTARSSMVQSAYAFKKTETAADSSDTALIRRAKDLMKTQIDSANQVLGLGYKETNPWKVISKTFGLCLIGWLITGLAISLGAPFWFDLLQKIMAMRQAGSKPVGSAGTSASPKSQTLSPNDAKNRVG